jgi:glucosamine--fructose-6-phosphate aminotransferase (isomerizing)
LKKSKKEQKLGKAVQIALNQVVGAYAAVLINKKKSDELVAADCS